MEVTLKCKYCENIWTYKGTNHYYATCPHCLHKVKVVKFAETGTNKSTDTKKTPKVK